MHPENIRSIVCESTPESYARNNNKDHIAEQLFAAWRTIVYVYDGSPEARELLGGKPAEIYRKRLKEALDNNSLTDDQIMKLGQVLQR